MLLNNGTYRCSQRNAVPVILMCLQVIIIAALVTCLSACGASTADKNKRTADTALITLPAPVPLSSAAASHYHSACAAWYDTVLRNRGFNGSILVAKNGNIVFEDYSGMAHIGGADSINASTSFHIASVSKTFTAMAVLKFCQDGKISLEDEYNKYFPQFNYPGVTIRTLLNHRSGLPNYVYFMETLGWDKTKFVTNQDVLDYLINRKPEITNIAPPNTHFTYCNTNYALLALLLEKLSGVKYPALMQRLFFYPLQMQHTFVFDTSMVQRVVPSYDWKGGLMEFNFLDAVYGDKNIYSTPRDLLTWDRLLYSKKIFTDSTLQEAFAPYSNEKPGMRNYGLGWRMNLYPNGKKIIYHNGWWHGNNASLIRLTEDSATVIILGNRFNRNIYHGKQMAVNFGDYATGSEEEEESSAKKEATAAPVSAKPLANSKRKPAQKKLTEKKKGIKEKPIRKTGKPAQRK